MQSNEDCEWDEWWKDDGKIEGQWWKKNKVRKEWIIKSGFTIGDEEDVTRIYQQLQLNQRFKSFQDEYSGKLIKETESIPQIGLSSLFKDIITQTKDRQK